MFHILCDNVACINEHSKRGDATLKKIKREACNK